MTKKNPWLGIEGYWISPEGNFREVVEHFREIKDDPGAFRFSAERVSKWTHEKDREKALIAAMKKGFIRVRGHRQYTTFELWKMTDSAMSHMKRLDDKVAFFEEEEVRIHELSTHKHWNGTMRELKYLSVDRFREKAE